MGREVFAPDSFPLNIWGIAFSPDGKVLAAGMGLYNGTGTLSAVWVWETHTATLSGWPAAPAIWAIAISPTDARRSRRSEIFGRRPGGNDLGSEDGTGSLDELTTEGPILRHAFSPDGNSLATASRSGAVEIRNALPARRRSSRSKSVSIQHLSQPARPSASATVFKKPLL